ncbi:MAG: hypothetical protein ACRDD1_17515 [Planctomycetia bacterium]
MIAEATILRHASARLIVDEVLCLDERNRTVQAILIASDGSLYGRECDLHEIEAESDGESLCSMNELRRLASKIIGRDGRASE